MHTCYAVCNLTPVDEGKDHRDGVFLLTIGHHTAISDMTSLLSEGAFHVPLSSLSMIEHQKAGMVSGFWDHQKPLTEAVEVHPC